MSEIPDEFQALLPKQASEEPPWRGPLYLYWVHDPMDDAIHLDHNKDRHRADAITHSELHPEITHPGRTEGYATKIKGGWRITMRDHKPIEDPHIKDRIDKTLREKFPPKPLPHIDGRK